MKEIKEVDKFDDIEIYHFAMRMNQIAKKAVRRAKEENRRLGVPNVFSENGIIYYELNGEITTKSPFEDNK